MTLVWLHPCIHGYDGICSFGDCPGGQHEAFDYEKAWDVFYVLADRRNAAGLTFEEFRTAVEGGK